MRHVILGPGGVGGLIGACLAHSGAAVTMVGRPETMAGYPAQLQLESPFGNFSVPVDHSEAVPSTDVVWITVKATQLESALRSFPHDAHVRAIVPLLNGVDHVGRLRAEYGAELVIPATIAVESERVAPGHIVHRSPFAKLNVAASGQSLLGETVATLAGMGFACSFVDSEATLLWSKLVFLAPLALASTAASKVVGEILSDAEWRKRLFGCIREAAAVATAEGASVESEAVISTVSGLPPHMRSSMQKDVERGKAPELEAIAGPILRGAERHHIEVPLTRGLVEAIENKIGAQASER
jgi:2-dehydropantoate 2-reductase